MDPRSRQGFDFEFDPRACAACRGRCCRGSSGYVWVNQEEIQDIAAFLQLNVIDFSESFLRREDNRLSIREKNTAGEFFCIFFDIEAGGCRIYPHRPAQCRNYPFWARFRNHPDKAMRECPGIKRKKNLSPGGNQPGNEFSLS